MPPGKSIFLFHRTGGSIFTVKYIAAGLSFLLYILTNLLY